MITRTHTRAGITFTVKLGHWFPRLLGHGAVTWNRVIRVRDMSMPGQLFRHEFQHLLQQEHDGLLRWTRRYLWQGIRYGYHGIDYELEAYAIQQQYVDTHDSSFQDVA